MVTRAELEEARLALRELMTGARVVSIQKDGRRVDYSQVSIGELKKYIRELEAQLGVSGRRPPAGVYL